MLVIDFRNCTVENYAQIKEKLKVLKVDILGKTALFLSFHILRP